VFLSQALAPLQGFTIESSRAPVAPWDCSHGVIRTSRLPRLRFPYRVFPVWGSAIATRLPRRAASCSEKHMVAPTGFRTLSTPCSPPDLPGLFHPGPAPGVHPSRLCSAVSAVRVSRPACTLMRFPDPQPLDPRTGRPAKGPASPGLCSPTAASQRRLDIAPYAAAVASMGFCPSEVCSGSFAGLSARFPSRALLIYRRERAHGGGPPAPQGSC